MPLCVINERLRVAVHLSQPRLRATVATYLAAGPLLPRWRVELVRPEDEPDLWVVDIPDQHTGKVVLAADDLSFDDLPQLLMASDSLGIVLASEPTDAIGRAIEVVMSRRGCWLSSAASGRLRALAGSLDSVALIGGSSLTPRQRDVFRLVADGMSNEAIAAALHVSLSTVKTHKRHILRKTGCTNSRELLAFVAGQSRGGQLWSAHRMRHEKP